MKRLVSLLLAMILILMPTLTFAISWGSILASMTKSELLELQSELEKALAEFDTVRPSATIAPKPLNVFNGKPLIISDYEGKCPFEVKADHISNYYIYLDYQYASSNSTTPKKKKYYASKPYESDIAFYLEKGKSYEIDVPVGVYKLYYATGETFYGTKLLFGEETRCYSSDDLLDFYCDGEYYNGHTITLYSVAGGNFDTDEIPVSSFPNR